MRYRGAAPVGILAAVLLCLAFQGSTDALATAAVKGDVNCTAGPNSVDALLLLRHTAGLPVELPQGCPEVGAAGAIMNGKIAYDVFENNNGDIYAMDANGANPTRLTDDPVFEWDPAWSPDGQHIAFDRQVTADDDIFVMKANGSGLTNLTNTPAFEESAPAWSSDGSQIAFQSDQDGGDFDIWMMDANGGNPHNLTADFNGDDLTPAWSPDGSKIAFSSERDGVYVQLYVMNSDGSGVVRIVGEDGYTASPSWSPDGGRIAFNMEAADNFDTYSVKPDGSDLKRLTDDPAWDGSPDWSPDGTLIVFETRRHEPDPEHCDNCNEEIYAMNADGSNETRLTNHAGADADPSWQPLRELNGDINCDGVINSVDALFILRFVAQLPVDLPAGCPAIGA